MRGMHALVLMGLLAAIKPASGTGLCDALTASDFTRVGIAVDKKPNVNLDDPSSAYCTYKGKSGAMGGVELDVFYPTQAKSTEATALGESSANYTDAHVNGVDDSRIDLHDVSGGPPFASLVVRKNDLVYVISIPAGPHADSQLRRLSQIVLQRLAP